MAGTIIADKIQTENAFLTLNVGATQIATMNTSGIYSSSGTKMIGTDGTIGVATIANTAITGNIISSQITSVANTQITGNITSSQIAPDQTLYGNVTISVIKVGQIQSSSGVIMANVNASGSNIGFQLASTLAPAFSATRTTTQTISSATYTKVLFSTEEFDTNNNFASSAFTPTVAGYYQLNAAVGLNSTGESLIQVYKNGASFKTGQDISGTVYNLAFSTLVYANGTTDYFEIYVYPGAGTTVSGATGVTYFQGFLARSAL